MTVLRMTSARIVALTVYGVNEQPAWPDAQVVIRHGSGALTGKIAFEGIETEDGRLIDVGALRLEESLERRLPVLHYPARDGNHYSQPVAIGRLTDLRRGENGAIIARGVTLDRVQPGRYNVGIDIDDVTATTDGPDLAYPETWEEE